MQGHNPTAFTDQVIGMSFPKALEKLIEGKKITKREWANSNIYGLLKDGFLMLRKADGKFYTWVVSEGDLRGQDWIVIDGFERKPTEKSN